MAARFWVTGGTGNWNSTTNWSLLSGSLSGASVPGSGDTATFDANSGSDTIVFATTSGAFKNVNFTAHAPRPKQVKATIFGVLGF